MHATRKCNITELQFTFDIYSRHLISSKFRTLLFGLACIEVVVTRLELCVILLQAENEDAHSTIRTNTKERVHFENDNSILLIHYWCSNFVCAIIIHIVSLSIVQ